MDYSITSDESFWRGGVNIQIVVNFTRDEEEVIAQHGMEKVIIVPRDETTEEYQDAEGKTKKRPFDNNIRFGEFYGRTTSWHADSSVEGQIFAQQLDEGFKRFKKLLDANAKPPDAIHEDFTPVNFDLSMVPFRSWFEHTYILGESGGGKTQLIQALFVQHRKSARPPGFIIVDSQNVMLPLIKRKFADAILIDPVVDPPYINPFDVKVSFTDHAAIFRLMETFRYLFESGGEPLTGRQRTVFERGVALMILGYPAAFGRPATIEDFEDYFQGAREKRSRTLSENARKAAHELPPAEWKWYESDYPLYDEACNQVLQRLNNLCGPYSPLRPLFMKGKKLDLSRTLDSGGIILINTNANYLQESGSAFFGRYFIKLLEQQMQSRTQQSHPLFFVIDEVQEYLDNSLVNRFLDQARKRNVACVFAHQRLSQLRGKAELLSAMTGVAVRFATNINDFDVEAAQAIWKAPSAEFITAQHREFSETPHYADYALYVRGWRAPKSVRVSFYQLENLPNAEQPRSAPPPPPPPPPPGRDKARTDQKTEPPPPPEPEFTPGLNDMVWEMTITPKLARDGGTKSVVLPSKRTVTLTIKAGTKDGTLMRLKKEAFNGGDLYIKLNVPPWPEKSKEKTWNPRGKPGDSDEHTAWG